MLAVLVAFLIGLFVAAAASFASFLLVCVGLPCEMLLPAQTAAPALGVLFSGCWLGVSMRKSQRKRDWLSPFCLGLIWVGVWWLVWCWMLTRLHGTAWPIEALPQLTATHVFTWGIAVLLVLLGYLSGHGPRSARYFVGAVATMLVPVSMAIGGFFAGGSCSAPFPPEWHHLHGWVKQHSTLVTCEHLGTGVTMLAGVDPVDATSWRLLIFDLTANPRLRLSIYDIDQHDADPGNDADYAYYALNVFWLAPRINRMLGSGRRVVALFNGGFFDLGRRHGFRGSHVEPEVIDGRLLYKLRDRSRWTFGVRYPNDRPQFEMIYAARAQSLANEFTCAVMGVQGLIDHGKRLRIDADNHHPETTIGPIPVIDTLQTDRTSVGWNRDSTRLYVTIVDDPDGEVASQRQKRAGGRQTGGWNIRQLQDFWLAVGVDSAVNLDGGGSTQLAYRIGDSSRAHYRYVAPATLGRTFGYWRNCPLRVEAPILPSWVGRNGVMNYFYVYEADGAAR